MVKSRALLPVEVEQGNLRRNTAPAVLLHAAAVRQKVWATWSRRVSASELMAIVLIDDKDDEEEEEKEKESSSVPTPKASSREAMMA